MVHSPLCFVLAKLLDLKLSDLNWHGAFLSRNSQVDYSGTLHVWSWAPQCNLMCGSGLKTLVWVLASLSTFLPFLPLSFHFFLSVEHRLSASSNCLRDWVYVTYHYGYELRVEGIL
jgi:hypothetical protein